MADLAGWSYEQLIDRILSAALEREAKNNHGWNKGKPRMATSSV